MWPQTWLRELSRRRLGTRLVQLDHHWHFLTMPRYPVSDSFVIECSNSKICADCSTGSCSTCAVPSDLTLYSSLSSLYSSNYCSIFNLSSFAYSWQLIKPASPSNCYLADSLGSCLTCNDGYYLCYNCATDGSGNSYSTCLPRNNTNIHISNRH